MLLCEPESSGWLWNALGNPIDPDFFVVEKKQKSKKTPAEKMQSQLASCPSKLSHRMDGGQVCWKM